MTGGMRNNHYPLDKCPYCGSDIEGGKGKGLVCTGDRCGWWDASAAMEIYENNEIIEVSLQCGGYALLYLPS